MIFYDKAGAPISVDKFSELVIDMDYKRVDETTISTASGDIWISTVWLGSDGAPLDGVPMIFETMAFDSRENERRLDDDDLIERYPTVHAAQAGHDRMVAKVREVLGL